MNLRITAYAARGFLVLAMLGLTCTWLEAVQVETLIDLTQFRMPALPDPLGTSIIFPSIDESLRRSHDEGPNIVPPKPTPPLSATLMGAIVSGSPKDAAITISIRIRNNGNIPYLFPTSFDSGRASVLPGQKGRRLMSFSVHMRRSGGAESTITFPVQTEGSVTFPNSMIELKQGSTMVVKFNASANSTTNWPTAARSIDLQLSVGLKESNLDDDGYIYKSISGEVLTENSYEVSIPR